MISYDKKSFKARSGFKPRCLKFYEYLKGYSSTYLGSIHKRRRRFLAIFDPPGTPNRAKSTFLDPPLPYQRSIFTRRTPIPPRNLFLQYVAHFSRLCKQINESCIISFKRDPVLCTNLVITRKTFRTHNYYFNFALH